MIYPSDVLLPPNSKFYGFVDKKTPYNPHWDISWSFTFALTGTEHAFCTYLTTNPNLSGGIPGQYMGYMGSDEFILNEIDNVIESENGDSISYDDYGSYEGGYKQNGVISIAFDSTGYFALSNLNNSGISPNNVKKNSLIVRDLSNTVIFNESLSSLDTSFFISSPSKSYQTLRFRFSNAGKSLYIDKKTEMSNYKTLATIPISYDVDTIGMLYPAFTFCSPISSSFITPSTMYLRNFHTQGCESDPSYETISCNELYQEPMGYATINGIIHNY
jgi:hypothetical protein